MFKQSFAVILALCLIALTAVGCGKPESEKAEETPAQTITTNLPKLDMSRWKQLEDTDFYYQVGIGYCEKPVDEKYEKLAVFVPGAFMKATDNGDGTFTCEIDDSANINGYTPENAPIVMSVETPAYVPAEAVSEELLTHSMSFSESIGEMTSHGFVYVLSGCRGSFHGVPSGVTDLKAAIRYLRYCDDEIAGDAQSIFVSGMSSGGAQAAILGASGDSELYDPYLEAIGAVQGVSDAVTGSMNWCPVTSLDTANAEYEWMMGCTRTGLTEEEKAISDGLAAAYVDYVNEAGFTDENGKALTLTESAHGIYQTGSYYNYLKGVIERSLSNYLSDQKFTPDDAQAYIDGLNADSRWIIYDKSTNTAKITSVEEFVRHCKPASQMFPAFDTFSGVNTLFGYGDDEGSHFDSILAGVLKDVNSQYADAFAADLAKTDFVGNTVEQRVNLYSPLYYLLKGQGGYGTSSAAKYWRIRSGIKQPTNALTTEVNLALALSHCDGVESVDFETVWDRGHEPAERTGDSVENFIAWIDDCMKG